MKFKGENGVWDAIKNENQNEVDWENAHIYHKIHNTELFLRTKSIGRRVHGTLK